MRVKLLVAVLLSSIFLAVMQFVALALHERYPIEWLFSPSHFLGGLCVGFAALYAHTYVKPLSPALILITSILVIGFAWEVMEYMLQLSAIGIEPLTDLVLDVAGAGTAFLLYRKYLV